MSLDPVYVLLGEVSVQVLCPLFNWIVCLPGVELCEFFIYFGFHSFLLLVIFHHVNVPILFLHSAVDGHLGYFQFLVHMNGATVNKLVHVSGPPFRWVYVYVHIV